jgi:transposase
MPAALPVPVRQTLFQRWQKGESVTSLAEELRLSPRTVRHLVQRFAARGASGLTPDYARCASNAAATADAARDKAVHLRQQHPTWGAGLIRVFLLEELQAAPSERTLQRWFAGSGLSPAAPGRRRASDAQRARKPHEVWQMDAADQLRLARGQLASWLRLVDECSGAVLKTTVFPPRVLGAGAAGGGAAGLAPAIWPLGTAATLPGR